MSNPPLPLESNTDPLVTELPPVPAWQQAVFEANEGRRKAEQRVAELESSRPSTPPVPEIKLEPGDAFNDPEKLVSRITRDLSAQSEDVNAYIRDQRRKDKYITLKAKFISGLNPDGRIAFSRVEALLDSAFYNNPNLDPVPHVFEEELTKVVGRLALSGGFSNPNPINNSPNSPNPTPPVIPPSTRPSVIPPKLPTVTFDESQFTENERRLARESNLTLEEYVAMRDCPPAQSETKWREILKAREDRKKNGGQ